MGDHLVPEIMTGLAQIRSGPFIGINENMARGEVMVFGSCIFPAMRAWLCKLAVILYDPE